MNTESIQLPVRRATERATLVRRARLLAGGGVAWHGLEMAIALGAGIAAGSIALIGFGADSLIEALAGGIVLWRFAGTRASSEAAERRAQKLIGLSFFLIAAYVGLEALRSLLAHEVPAASWVGIGLAVVTAITMPLLARAKARVGDALSSSATKGEGRKNFLRPFLWVALLWGWGQNPLCALGGAPPATALVIAGVAIKEGRESWR